MRAKLVLVQRRASHAIADRNRVMADDKTTKSPIPGPGAGTELLLYQTEDGQTRIEVRLVGDTLWLTQNQMAELFQVDKSGISRHLKNIFETGDLSPNSVVAEFAATAADGKTYQVGYHNLDAIISVGSRLSANDRAASRGYAHGL